MSDPKVQKDEVVQDQASQVLIFAKKAEPSLEVLRKADEADQRNTGQFRE